jgi:hypothetical protein
MLCYDYGKGSPLAMFGGAMAGAGSSASEPAAGMAAVLVLFTWEDVQNGPPQRKVGARIANQYLKKVREENTEPLGNDNIYGIKERCHDLNFVTPDVFDWRGWLAHRMVDTKLVIGTGVAAIGLGFFPEYDANMRQERIDFIIKRTDGTFVRLHPEASGGRHILFTRKAFTGHG